MSFGNIVKNETERYLDKEQQLPKSVLFVPKTYKIHTLDGRLKEYNLSYLQRCFLLLEYPSCCYFGVIINYFMTTAIIASVVSVIASSFHSLSVTPNECQHPACYDDSELCPGRMICEPVVDPVFNTIDLVCVAIFAIDFAIRIMLCPLMPTRISGVISIDWDELESERAKKRGVPPRPEPYYPPWTQLFYYIFTFRTFIDIISIVPSIVSLTTTGANLRLSFIRILRLMRMLRLLRASESATMNFELLARTMLASKPALGILTFFLGLLVIFFGSIVYVIEQGTFTVTSDYPNGVYLRPNGFGGLAQSPFNNIPTSLYYMIVTMTTVGYGDLSPTTLIGRALAALISLLGVLVLALPISVVGSNFNKEYENHLKRVKLLKHRRKQLKKHHIKNEIESHSDHLSPRSIASNSHKSDHAVRVNASLEPQSSDTIINQTQESNTDVKCSLENYGMSSESVVNQYEDINTISNDRPAFFPPSPSTSSPKNGYRLFLPTDTNINSDMDEDLIASMSILAMATLQSSQISNMTHANLLTVVNRLQRGYLDIDEKYQQQRQFLLQLRNLHKNYELLEDQDNDDDDESVTSEGDTIE